jgi:hypothetical protein
MILDFIVLIVDAFMQVVKSEGVLGLFKGLSPALMGMVKI